MGLTTFGSTVADTEADWGTAVFIAAKGMGLIGAVALLMQFVLPRLTRRLAHSQELLILFAIAWAVFFGAAGEWLGFSKEVGAFLAGVSLASTRYRDAIGTRLTSLRDFLLLFFFVDLGARLDWSSVGSQVGASVVLSLFVLIGNPLIVLVIMGVMGYRCRTSFLAGLTVAQISEFSLIVAALGLAIGHINEETMGLITLVGVLTIRDISLGAMTGVSILAVSRAGRVFDEPNPEFQVFPGDRLLLMGPPDDLREAEAMLHQTGANQDVSSINSFKIAEVRVADDSVLSGRTLAEVRFRQRYGVTLVGIRRGESEMTSVSSFEQFWTGDHLIVIGTTAAVERLREEEPL